MKLAIMQPYFLPYIGYFQLIKSVDKFIVYDNIQYTKKGWINRNRFLQNGNDVQFSIPLKKDSDFLDVKDRTISVDFRKDKLLNQLKEAYRRAPYFPQTYPLIDAIVQHDDSNLFRYLQNSILKICSHLNITTEIIISSTIAIDRSLKGQDKVLALCKAVGASTYINAIGGMELYSKDIFGENGIDLKFIKSTLFEYPQFGHAFVPWLSIIDVMMFNAVDVIKSEILLKYDVV